jgi:hypothetical protein
LELASLLFGRFQFGGESIAFPRDTVEIGDQSVALFFQVDGRLYD